MTDTPTRSTDAFLARQVEAMAGYGIPARDIAIALGIEQPILERDYRMELDAAAIKANSRVAENLYRRATADGREAVTAAIFWLKTRAGWREPNIHELRSGNSEPISVVIQRFGDHDQDASGEIEAERHLPAIASGGHNDD